MTTDIISSLEKNFGFSSFRPGQAEAIQSLLKGEHTLVVMPTGSGKSLIYQLAALHLPGITLVISPLIALMKDQVDSLDRRGIAATFINSTLTGSEQNRRLQGLVSGSYRIVYIAPERLHNTQFLNALKLQKVSLLAVDEAHCISEWGHDFRPDYLHIDQFRANLGNPLTVALTATATSQVQDDIARQLKLSPIQPVVTGFNRPNLALEVRYISDPANRLKALQDLIKNQGDGAAIIYTGTRRDAEEVAEFVNTIIGIKAQHYHAGLLTEERTRIQDEFMAGDLPIVAATNAFGMGIDRPDVRQVIHYSLPGSLEAYYQEAGRAGRDELPSRAVLLYSPDDRALQEWFIENSNLSIDDLRLLYDALRLASEKQEPVTIVNISLLTGMQEVKAWVGLAALERASALERQGDEGIRVWFKLLEWKNQDIRFVIERHKQHQIHRKKQLEYMVAYAESNACRRHIILEHFGDSGRAEAPICCDNCQVHQLTSAPVKAIEELAQSERVALIVLDTIHRMRIDVGKVKIAQILKGSKAKDIQQFGYNNIYYGRLAVFSQDEIKKIIDQLLIMKYIKVIGGKYPVLHLTSQGEAAIRNKVSIPVNLRHHTPSQTIRQSKSDDQHDEIAVTILDCVRTISGKLPRSSVAKLLVGSASERVHNYRDHPFFNKLAGQSRSIILGYIDQLLDSGQLAQDENGHLIPKSTQKVANLLPEPLPKIPDKPIITQGEKKPVSGLIAFLHSPNANTRRLAASALGRIADKQATKPLIELLSHEKKHQVRQCAVKALGEIQDISSMPILEAISHDPQEKEFTRIAAQNALKRLASKKATQTPCTDNKSTQSEPPLEDPILAFLSRPHPRQLSGPWDAGWALGFHSQFTGADWKRSGAGELAYRLKYQDDLSALPMLVEQAVAVIVSHPELAQVDAVMPVPTSTPRTHDPVSIFAKTLADRIGISFLPVLIKSRQTSPQKELHTLAQKHKNVAGAFSLQSPIKGKRLLVVDDLFDSGATLEEIYLLLRKAGAAKVCVLTMTRTIHSDA